jgi:prohibitin 2
MDDTPSVGSILISVVVVIGLIILFISATVIEQTERGVLTRFGVIQEVLEPGFHFINPFTQDVYKIDVSVQALAVDELVYSKDSQIVKVQATVNYQVDASRVKELFEEVRRDAEARYVIPRSKDALKEIISGYTAQGIIENRGKLTVEIKNRVAERLIEDGIFVQDVSVTNFDFDDLYEAAVQNKQVEEQRALGQVNVTKQEEEKKKQEILRAEALAEKTRLEVEALSTSQGGQIIEKIRAEAELEAARRWNGQLPTNLYGSAPLPILNVGN